MDFLSGEFISGLLAIIMIDLVLAGDNAILIGLAARKLPKDQQKKVIIWGAVGAIVIRIIATLLVVVILKVPGLHLIGGLLLVWIAYKLLIDEEEHDLKPADSMWAAIKTIIIADALMGLDNVLAVAGASHGNFTLVVIGLLVSIPVVMYGSTLILKLIERFPFIIIIGAGILGWTASKMIVAEPFMHDYFVNPFIKYGFEAIVVIGILVAGTSRQQKIEKEKANSDKMQIERNG
ncbi:TerC family protein [Peribacillus simplex]|uniref:TerC family protein n=1 Tax=Peribacillus simplex TaxID=1478 RepID=A0AAW7IHC5_9BACI|nr:MULTISPECIES: TerC family protein [Peribacillus]SNT28650.1 integral membrane protein, YjbE family [Bacillus sp. OK838]AMM93341.1 membrane protein [Peribacillus simplex]MDF9761243.1 YjbE family integral membrane protein [Peribacillus simplex]MDM5294492.1 TerC family protein [Peribacillus simplex]MDM5453442.1 TerC family protein [Peribacillus simplex]